MKKGLAFSFFIIVMVLLLSSLSEAQQPLPPPSIDQPPQPEYMAAGFSAGNIWVEGDDSKFMEDFQLDDTFTGGLDYFVLRHPFGQFMDWLIKAEIRTLPGQRDHQVMVELVRKKWFFARMKYQRFPRYYDDTGGVFKPFQQPFFQLGVGPSVFKESLITELGLIHPDLPYVTFSHERWKRDGDISSLYWGPALESELGLTRRIVPTSKEVDEEANIFKLNIQKEHDIANVEVEQRWDFTRLTTNETRLSVVDGSTQLTEKVKRDFDYDQSLTTVKIDRAFLNKRLHLFGSYRFDDIDTDSGTIVRFFDQNGSPTLGPFHIFSFGNRFKPFSDNNVTSHNWKLGILGVPIKDLIATGDIKLKAVHRRSVASFFDDRTLPFDFSEGLFTDISNRWNDFIISEAFKLTYKRIQGVVPFAEVEFQQGDVDIKEREVQITPTLQTVRQLRNADADFDKQIYRAGVSFYPFRKLHGSVQYKKEITRNDYDDITDNTPGYSGFITEQNIESDKITFRLTGNPISSLWNTFRYEFRPRETRTETDTPSPGTPLGRETTRLDIHTFTNTISYTPISPLHLSNTVMYQKLWAKTGVSKVPVRPLRPFDVQSYTLINSVLYALNQKTDLSAEHDITWSDNFKNVVDITLPLEEDNTIQRLTFKVAHKYRENMTLWTRYDWFDYDESHFMNVDNYRGHLFSAGVEIRWR